MPRTTATDSGEQKLLDDVAKFGWHCMKVFGDNDHEPFTYTIGLFASCGYPELLIYGLPGEVAHSGTGNDLIAKRGPCPSQNVDLAVKVARPNDDSIPSARFGPSAIGHRLRSASWPLGRAQHELHVFALQKCEEWTRLTSDPKSQVLLAERDRLVDVVYDVPDHKCA